MIAFDINGAIIKFDEQRDNYNTIRKIFLEYVDEEALLAMFNNWKIFSRKVLGDTPIYLHGGHLMDRAGYKMFKELMLKDVPLNKEAKVAERLNWAPQEYKANINVKHV